MSKNITVNVPIAKIEPYIRRGLEFIKQSNIKSWNEEVDEFWEKVEGRRHFWFFNLKYPTRESVETELGKPSGKRGTIGSRWNFHRGATEQIIQYRQLLQLFDFGPRNVVTMQVSEYVVIMSFDEKENTITT